MKKKSRPATRLSTDSVLAGVREVYEQLEDALPERNCISRADCCHFVLTGKTPFLTKGEALLLAHTLRGKGKTQLPKKTDGSCPLLDPATRKCTTYEGRPFGCRTHFCRAAGGPVPRRDLIDLIRKLEEIDALCGGDGPHALETALRAALAQSQTRK